jgi:hypothetical protein
MGHSAQMMGSVCWGGARNEQQKISHFAEQSFGYDLVTLHYLSSDFNPLLSLAVV